MNQEKDNDMNAIHATKIIEWDMAHRIPNHHSACANIHGHRYRAEVTVCGKLVSEDGASDQGMVCDFSDIKKILKEEIHDPHDHGFMYYKDDEQCAKAIAAMDIDQKAIVVDFIPTAENMAFHFWKVLNERVTKMYGHRVFISNVRIFETPNSWADYGIQ